MIAGLALHERADLLGLTSRQYLDLAREDARIVAAPALGTRGAVGRLRRWLESGRPAANMGELVFIGEDAIRAILLDTLRQLPAPCQEHAVMAVTWFAIGHQWGGVMFALPAAPCPAGDERHGILLSCHRLEHLPFIIAHELAHSWQRRIGRSVFTGPPMSDAEEIQALRSLGASAEQIAVKEWRGERLADDLAEAWGFRSFGHTSDHVRMASIRAGIAAAAQRGEP